MSTSRVVIGRVNLSRGLSSLENLSTGSPMVNGLSV